MKMAESSPNGSKTMWEKERLLVTSNFSFSCSFFKRLLLQTRKNQVLFGKGLKSQDLLWEKEKILVRYTILSSFSEKNFTICTYLQIKSIITQTTKFMQLKIEILFGKGKKHCRKRRKCWFQKPSLSGPLKVWIVWLRVKSLLK